ncbi:MAG TPA: 5'-methylthioadenosine/adenosylhomocysteine nucleosidase [Bacillota bacterium]|nr:5'-methylthioadenosine/adenosylhomocysteine nucleosidase [Bacillota bacterium]
MIGVITAVDAERDAVLAKMKEVKAYQVYGIEFYEGLIRDTRCITAMSGIGKVNAARCTQLMIDRFNPDRIVNIGSAGALYPDLQIGDVIISTSCIQHDVDLTPFGLRKGFFSETDGFVAADAGLVSLCQQAMEHSIDDRFHVYTGPIATGDQFNDSAQTKERLFEEFGAYCIEMEGAAVAQVCAMCEIPFVVIRSVSDTPTEETRNLYENFKQLASERCANFLTNLVKLIQKSNVTAQPEI